LCVIVNLLANLALGCLLAGRGASARPWGECGPNGPAAGFDSVNAIR
jgi:hypothetical protein